MVKRYDLAPFNEYADNEIFIMQESKAGDYVEYEDYQALQAKLEAIQEKLEEFCWLIGTTEEEQEMRALVLDTEPSSVLVDARVKAARAGFIEGAKLLMGDRETRANDYAAKVRKGGE